MKRLTASLLLLICLCLPLRVFASEADLVVDNAGLFTQEELQELTAAAERVSSEYGMDTVILTVPSLEGKSARDYADDYYDYHDYRYDGILILLAMEERDWYISTSGEAIQVFTDYDIQELGDRIVPYLSSGYYFWAFQVYLEELPDYFDAYEGSEAVDDSLSLGGALMISSGIGLVIAAIVTAILCGTMNTKRRQYSAGEYLVDGSFRLPVRQDIFLYSNVTKTKREQNNSSGGSSTHTSSSGNTHGGGGGKF